MKVRLTICEDVIENPDGTYTAIRPFAEDHEFVIPESGEFLPVWCVIDVETEAADRGRTRTYKQVTVGPDGNFLGRPMRGEFRNEHAEANLAMHAAGPARFPVATPGKYTVRISVDNAVVARRVIVVVPRPR